MPSVVDLGDGKFVDRDGTVNSSTGVDIPSPCSSEAGAGVIKNSVEAVLSHLVEKICPAKAGSDNEYIEV